MEKHLMPTDVKHDADDNPKLDERPGSNTIRKPDEWVSGNEPRRVRRHPT
jgi:hypothetical protein